MILIESVGRWKSEMLFLLGLLSGDIYRRENVNNALRKENVRVEAWKPGKFRKQNGPS